MARMRIEDLREILARREGDAEKIRTFIETGTYRAERALMARYVFDDVVTIELSYSLFEKAYTTYGQLGRIKFHQGDSAEILPEILELHYKVPCVIFLDAHHFDQPGCEPDIASENPMPLKAELEAIATRPPGDIVIVDDVHAFGCEGNWKEIDPIWILYCLGVWGDACDLAEDDDPFWTIQNDQMVIWR